jgi:hypothetical protein
MYAYNKKSARDLFSQQEVNEVKFPQIDLEPKAKKKYPQKDYEPKAARGLFFGFLISIALWCIIISLAVVIF